jgi:hypothetical protein
VMVTLTAEIRRALEGVVAILHVAKNVAIRWIDLQSSMTLSELSRPCLPSDRFSKSPTPTPDAANELPHPAHNSHC